MSEQRIPARQIGVCTDRPFDFSALIIPQKHGRPVFALCLIPTVSMQQIDFSCMGSQCLDLELQPCFPFPAVERDMEGQIEMISDRPFIVPAPGDSTPSLTTLLQHQGKVSPFEDALFHDGTIPGPEKR